MPTPIRNIVFDIGRVLVNLHFERLEAFLRHHNAHCENLGEFYRLTKMNDFEHGHIDENEFITRMQALFTTSLPRENLHHAFLDIFSPNEPILNLTETLRTDYRLYILSNTNSLHWSHLHAQYDLGNRVHGVITSFEARAMKPAASIYQFAERQYGLLPMETLFIDDLLENVRGAETCGWQAIHHTDNVTTLSALTQKGLI